MHDVPRSAVTPRRLAAETPAYSASRQCNISSRNWTRVPGTTVDGVNAD